MRIGVPKEIKVHEYRVGLVPAGVRELVGSGHAGPAMSIAAGATLVAGGFIVGAVITPDMSRFNRSAADVVKQTIAGFTLGEYTIGLIGVLLAHAVKTANVIGIVTTTSGAIGPWPTMTRFMASSIWPARSPAPRWKSLTSLPRPTASAASRPCPMSGSACCRPPWEISRPGHCEPSR